MTYVAHPYASASPCANDEGTKIRPQRPKIITASSSPATFFDATSPSSSTISSPSPITFARASLISPLHRKVSDEDKENMREKDRRDRRRGLMAAEKSSHAALDALLRAPEVAPRAAPEARMPQLARSATNISVVPTIEKLPHVTSDVKSDVDKIQKSGSGCSSPTLRASSPTSSSGSGSAPSTPGQPRTPVSFQFDTAYTCPSVAPLSISKTNRRSPSPIGPLMLHSSQTASPPSSEGDLHKRRRSRGRFSARSANTVRADRVSVLEPLGVDTAAARSFDLSRDSSREVPTLTGVLAEFEREVLAIPPLPPIPVSVENCVPMEKEVNKVDDEENEWLDIEEDPLRLEDAEFYRADIASHVQLFSKHTFLPSSRHRREGSSSSLSQWQLPPARPDSLPPPPHFISSFSSLPPLPDLPGDIRSVHTALRRASASSLASTASNRSDRSTGSSSGKSKRRSMKNVRISRSNARHSAAISVGRRRSSKFNRPLPPIPGRTNEKDLSCRGPSPSLDPSYGAIVSSSRDWQRPPPRFSIPVSVDEDVFGEDITFAARDSKMGRLVEEDEDEDGLIDPFVLGMFPLVDASKCMSPTRNELNMEDVDQCSFPAHSARSSLPLSPSSLSPLSPSPMPHTQSQRPLFLIPESPAPLSSFQEQTESPCTGTFDAESLYSSYVGFSPSSTSSTSIEGDARKNSAHSIYLDTSGRPLQSRWSVSTFASSSVPPTASSSRSFFPKKLGLGAVPSRLSARLRAARERSLQQAREREEKEREKPPVIKPYPFFPTPTPPSPKRKANPGPGKYIPKPELMPQKKPDERSASVSSDRARTATGSPRSSCETVNTSTASSYSPKGKDKGQPTYVAQYAGYRAHRHSAVHYAHSPSPSVSSPVLSYPSPPRTVKPGPSSMTRKESTDSLSAFPFTLAGEGLNLALSGPTESMECIQTATPLGRRDSGPGLRRKPIPIEIFSRA